MRVLILCPYPAGQAPSQRFRFEQYLKLLENDGYRISQSPFWSLRAWRVLYKPGQLGTKLLGVIHGLGRRLWDVLRAIRYDVVFIHRECLPVGPPIVEWLLCRLLRKRVIYDFDDAIWIPNTSAENWFAARLKWHSKVGHICRWSYRVSAGNEYLCEYARQFNSNVVLNPTTIDTELVHNRTLFTAARNTTPVIGWTGTHSTLIYLEPLVPVLRQLEETVPFEFLVICNKAPDFSLKSLRFLPWNKETEIPDLMRMDIGVMPLQEDAWAAGKCGFKALQYMALGIPAILSPVGVNRQIIQHGANGYLCASAEEWFTCLLKLIQDRELRHQLGEAGHTTVEDHFSVRSNERAFKGLFLR